MKLGFMRLALGTALVGATLSAQALSLKWEGFTTAGSVRVDVSGPPAYDYRGGAFDITIDSNPFVTYCVELGQFAKPGPWEYTSVAAASHFGDAIDKRRGKLFTHLNTDPTHSVNSGIGAGIGAPGTTTYSGAIQLAIWESVFESTTTPLSLSTGSFHNRRDTDASALTLANTLLGGAASISESQIKYSVEILKNGTYQDYIRVQKLNFTASPQNVPEPASWALAGLALAGLRVARRRRT